MLADPLSPGRDSALCEPNCGKSIEWQANCGQATRIGMRSGVELNSWLFSGTLAAALLWPCVAGATLGEPESSIATEPQLGRVIKATDLGAYRVHESQLPSGTVLREYAAANGDVFAVTWRGPFVPNLKQLLGRYFEEYAAGAKVKYSDHHHVEVRQSDLVVQAGGHMRATAGRAYLPLALPAGVTPGDLQ
jgi:hypothetical protein